jgi:phospholipid/cholesterol/gamma-HCH transport system ATP-binding protein
MIKVCNLKKSFKEKEILKNISLEFEKGKTNFIIGESGSGKTLFLRCLLGLLEVTSGDIFYEGINSKVMNSQEKRQLRSKIGVVFQKSALFDSMNVEENVTFPLLMFANISKKEMKERTLNVLERVKLIDDRKKLPNELSGGMQKRVAIARAVVNNPKFLFCDEPNSGLDPKTSILIDNLIYELTREYKTTTVVISHDMNSVVEIAEKVILFKKGSKVWEGNSTEILKVKEVEVIDFFSSSSLFKKLYALSK